MKLIESLLAEVPDHPGLLLAACRGFTTYTYAYVHLDADMVADRDIAQARAMRARASRLYHRAHGYGLRGLERKHPGLGVRLQGDARAAAAELDRDDLPLLYWTAAALGLGISANRNDPEMLARLPEVDALIDRALEIDETWQEGALHEFEIILVGTRPGSTNSGNPRSIATARPITPISAAYGVDPIHLGIIFLANLELGYIVPPMGENLFLSSYRFGHPVMRVFRFTLPFILILAAAVLLITYLPVMTLSLGQLLGR